MMKSETEPSCRIRVSSGRLSQSRAGAFVLAVAMGVSGCAVFQPHIEPDIARPGILRNEKGLPDLDSAGAIQPVHVSVPVAREYARFLEDAYRSAAGQQAGFRRAVDTTLVSTAAAALGVALTGGGSETAGLLGLGGATVSLWGSRMLQATQRTIYFQGAQALECVVGVANSSTSADIASLRFESSLNDLRVATRELELARESFQREVKAVAGRGDAIDPSMLFELGDRAARNAEIDLAFGSRLLEVADPLGQLLLSKVESIRILVDREIARSEPDLLTFDDALKATLAAPMNAYGGIAAVPKTKTEESADSEVKSAGSFPAYEAAAKRFAEAIDRVNQSRQYSMELAREVSKTSRSYGPELFSGCSLLEIGQSLLRIEPANVAVAADSAAHITVLVTGGSGRYKETVPQRDGVTVALKGSELTVRITKAAAASLATSSIHVVVEDAVSGQSRLLTLTKESGKEAATTSGSSSSVGTGTQATVPNTCPDKTIQEIQRLLVRRGYRLGNTGPNGDGIDCVFGDQTRVGAKAYLAENLEDLKAKKAGDAAVQALAAPQVNALDDATIIKYMAALL